MIAVKIYSELKGMGELHDELAVKIRGRLAAISEFIEDNKQVVAGSINIVQSEIHSHHITAAVVLDDSAG